MHLFVPTLIIAVKCGTYLAIETQAKRLRKLKNRAAIILNVNNNVDQRTALHALSWEPIQI